ncbi:MAG: lptA [Hydrocarboniphaga sp.]|uniref:lipopolysaccharide transport periplasmic protein LptA n=1 Tax=Hydrocarboniphaga sp. TaxID=2033016 RepID=UPI0026237362|nr:lipopolysaccharide transport periplasmic protein LptA [Hydrocarboniphaga sp.]MDB5969593.1 lptA [Hydrocarboniphaga sp.]
MYRASAEVTRGGGRVLAALSMLAASTVMAATAAPAAPTTSVPVAKPIAKPQTKQGMSDRMRPTGPITVTATSVDWAKNGLMVYTGNVKLSSDTLNMDGDRLELEQLGDGQYRAKINGVPAHLLHQGVADDEGQQDPPVTARGKQLNFDSQSGLADVIGDARVTRGEDEITGETIHYNVNERRIQAAGGTGGQVRIVIQPPAKDKNEVPAAGAKPAAPAPANKAPADTPPSPAPVTPPAPATVPKT